MIKAHVTDNYKPPKSGTPIALRLVPLITGRTIQELFTVLTKPFPYVDRDIIFLNTYQWPMKQGSPVSKPATALRQLLTPAIKAESFHDAIAEIPSNFFVWSEDIESCVSMENDCMPIPYHARPDWDPYLSGLEGLIKECPPPLRTICTFTNKPKHTPREKGKKITEARDDLLEDKCNEIFRDKPGLTRDEVARILNKLDKFKTMSRKRIIRLMPRKNKQPKI